MKNINFSHGGNIYFYAKKYGLSASRIIDSSASIVPFAAPKFLTSALHSEINNHCFKYYPEKELKSLREVIGKFHNIEPEKIMPGNGAAEVITWVGLEASKYGKNCLPIPGFSDYERSLNCWRAEYFFKKLPKKYISNSAQDFPLAPSADVIWITNPHNPTGQLWKKQSLENLLNRYKLVICDEAFISITPEGEKESLIPLTKKYNNLIVIRSLTKLFSIPGLRLGYLISTSEKINNLMLKRDPWPLNNFAIRAGITLLKDEIRYANWTKKIHHWVLTESKWFKNELKKIRKIKVYDSTTNFFLIESENKLCSNINYLASKGILIRECNSFRSLNSKWARISIQNRRKNKLIVKAIQESFLK